MKNSSKKFKLFTRSKSKVSDKCFVMAFEKISCNTLHSNSCFNYYCWNMNLNPKPLIEDLYMLLIEKTNTA